MGKRLNIKIPAIISLMLVYFMFVQAFYVHAIANGYSTTDTGLQTGMVAALSLNSSSGNDVERATQLNSDKVIGVVTTVESSLVSVSSGNPNQVLIELDGSVSSYVSDLNGQVKQGDFLVLSPLKGILMNSRGTSLPIVGVAISDPQNSTTYKITDGDSTSDAQVYTIEINLNQKGGISSASSINNSVLSKLGRSLVGKEVSEARVLMALVLFILVLIAEGGIIYGAVSSSITSLGRNPMAKKMIHVELVRVVVVALSVLLVGLAAVFSVIWI